MLARAIAKKLSQEDTQNRLDAVRGVLMRLICPFKAYLFGSAARLEMDTSSDVDVYVIFVSEKDLKSHSHQLYASSAQLGFPIDWILVSQTEFERRSKIGGLAYDIAKDAAIFYERVTTEPKN